MPNVEIYVDELSVKKNGHKGKKLDAKEDLVVAAKWIGPSFRDAELESAFVAKDVIDDTPIDFAAAAGGAMPKDLERRLFKTRVETTSIIKLSLIKKEKLGTVSKLFTEILAGGIGLGIDAATGGLGKVIAGKAAGMLFDIEDEWEYVLGEAQIEIDEQNIQSGQITIDFEITDKVKKALIRAYTKSEYDRPTRRLYNEPSDEIVAFLRRGNSHNGSLALSIQVF